MKSALFKCAGAVALLAALSAACLVVTGGTDGYALAPSDAGKAESDASDAAPSPGLTLGCVSALDCADASSSGLVCCLSATSTSSASSACAAAPCTGLLSPQLCASSGECDGGDGASCTTQSCTFAGATVTLHACGLIATCTPL